MKSVRELHHEAMQMAQSAFLSREYGDTEMAMKFAAMALPLERAAAELIENTPESEPTRSILYLSAASLALQVEDYDQARALVQEGMNGFPPPRTEHDLAELAAHIPA